MAETKKAPVAKKPVAKKAVAKKPVAKKPAAKKAAPKKPGEIGAQQRYRMVEVAAYFLAERNKFAGDALEYWTKAEAQIKEMLGSAEAQIKKMLK